MIRIKAPRVWGPFWNHKSADGDDFGAGRLYTEAMHRRVLALVRAVERYHDYEAGKEPIWGALAAMRAQAEKEAGK